MASSKTPANPAPPKKAAKASAPKTKKQDKPAKLSITQILDAIGEEVIFERIANCEFIHKIAESCGISAGSLHNWLNDRPEMYARARERQADKLVADMLQIADDGINDTYQDKDGNILTDNDVIARSRLRVDARKWLAGKMNAKKYGDKLDIQVNEKVVNIIDLGGREAVPVSPVKMPTSR